jgi:hypothetical protein
MLNLCVDGIGSSLALQDLAMIIRKKSFREATGIYCLLNFSRLLCILNYNYLARHTNMQQLDDG